MYRRLGFSTSLAAALIAVGLASIGTAAGTGDPVGFPEEQLFGPDFRISGNAATSFEEEPAVAYNSTDDEYFVIWSDARGWTGRGWEIYGQRIAANGTLVGANRRISDKSATANEDQVAVAYNSTDNQYLVVWRDKRREATRQEEIYGQRVAADGSRLGPNFRISGAAAVTAEYWPAVAYNSADNQYLVVWADERNYLTGDWDIYGQRIAADGSLVGANRRISNKAAVSQERNPAVAYNPVSNQYLVVWQDWRDGATRQFDIYGQRVAANGNRTGPGFRISGNAATGNEDLPAVVHNSTDNQYLVVWSDNRNWTTRGWDVYCQRVAANGNRIGTNRRISKAGATSHEGMATVAYNSVGNHFFVVWADYRHFPVRGWDIFGQQVGANGNRVGPELRISSPAATAYEELPDLAYNPTRNQYLVVREDARNAATRQLDIYGRRIRG